MGDDPKGDKPPKCEDGDMMSVGPDLGGVRPFIRHTADHRIEAGLAKVTEPGAPMPENALLLKHRAGTSLYDVHPLEGGSDHKNGPAQVATDAYRTGWDNIFGKKPTVGLA
jgi:hypothetical protein